MNLNLPILNQLSNCKNLLIAGMGGGYDIFCGLPIYFELRRLGIKAHLANLITSRTQGSKLWISPLMSIYWFFELSAITVLLDGK